MKLNLQLRLIENVVEVQDKWITSIRPFKQSVFTAQMLNWLTKFAFFEFYLSAIEWPYSNWEMLRLLSGWSAEWSNCKTKAKIVAGANQRTQTLLKWNFENERTYIMLNGDLSR